MRNGAFKHDPMHLGWETVLLEWLLVVTMRCEVGMGNVEKRNRLQTFLREEHRADRYEMPWAEEVLVALPPYGEFF